MSKTTKKKHVVKEVLHDYILPEGEQQIVKVICGRGNNLHEVENPKGEKFLASMPTKFRKNVWIKRGDFVIVEPIEEGDKVKAEIVHILYKDQVKYIKQEGIWPTEFNMDKSTTDRITTTSEDCENLFVNPNRINVYLSDTEPSSSEEESD